MKKTISVLLSLLVIAPLILCGAASGAEDVAPFDVSAKSAVLMDSDTGTVLYSKNADEPLPPASVTKIMTLLLVMEAVDSGNLSLDEEISVSEHAAGMGGSQIFLEAGETMKTDDLIKSVVIASANDAALALAERVAGSEEAFVAKMNERAQELGMKNTNFENVTGLDDDTTNHVTSAYDIALMSRELMKHKKIFDYSTKWMDSVRDGAFGLTNTNRLIRFYKGATGLKTGSTSKAKFCISATAERDGLHLIAVIMGSDTRDTRNEAAKTLLDWGFANYGVYRNGGGKVGEIKVDGGKERTVGAVCPSCELLLPRDKTGTVTQEVMLKESVPAPVKAGDPVGKIRYLSDGEVLSEADVTAASDVGRVGWGDIFVMLLRSLLLR